MHPVLDTLGCERKSFLTGENESMSCRQASIRHRIVSPRQNSSAAMCVETEAGVCCVQTSEQPECGDTNTARTVLLSTLAVAESSTVHYESCCRIHLFGEIL